jgi:tetratricopeptide (TPR) repeat protein
MRAQTMTRADRLEGFAQRDPSNTTLLLDLAEACHQAGEHERALLALDRLPQPDRAAGQALRGQVLLALARWDEAAALYDNALLGAPSNPALLFNLAYALMGADRDAMRASALLAQAAQFDPSNVRIARWQALALDALGDAEGARAAAQRAVALQPDDVDARLTLSQLLLDTGDTVGALEAARHCTATHPALARGWAHKGQIELMQLDAAAAAKSFRRALELDGRDLDTRLGLAQASMMTGRTQHARRMIDEALASDPANDAAWGMLGWVHAAQDDLVDARAAFDKALSLAPDSGDAWAAVAGMHLAAGERDSAERAVAKALTLAPGHVLALMVQAELHKTAGQLDDAQQTVAALMRATPFGAAGPDLASVMRQAAASPAVRRVKQRALRNAPPPMNPSSRRS